MTQSECALTLCECKGCPYSSESCLGAALRQVERRVEAGAARRYGWGGDSKSMEIPWEGPKMACHVRMRAVVPNEPPMINKRDTQIEVPKLLKNPLEKPDKNLTTNIQIPGVRNVIPLYIIRDRGSNSRI